MELRSQIEIDAPAQAVWQVLGERFAHIGHWAAAITSSCPVGADEPGVGVVRACHIPRFGPVPAGTIKEGLTVFDRDQMALEYEAVEGMPNQMADAGGRRTRGGGTQVLRRAFAAPSSQARCYGFETSILVALELEHDSQDGSDAWPAITIGHEAGDAQANANGNLAQTKGKRDFRADDDR